MRNCFVAGFLGSVVLVAAGVAACGGGNDGSEFIDPSAQNDGGSSGSAPEPPGDFGSSGTPRDASLVPTTDAALDCDADPASCLPPAVCGDKKAGLGESCDDGNVTNGDGCSAECQIEAPYWACAFGEKCVDVRNCEALIEAGIAPDAGCTPPPKAPVCGDGFIDPSEACDDGNQAANDGCSLDCTAIEANYVCATPGAKCVSTMVCGDGTLQGTESCDDGNKTSGDGCSAMCTLESGWLCPLPGTACNAAKCGDGIRAGSEECDDGNTADNDGCSATCRLQTTTSTMAPTATTPGKTTIVNWKCSPGGGGACSKTVCGTGSGVREGTEQCDDGNNRAFDGCSPDCQLEPNCPDGKCKAVCGDGLLFDFDGDGNGVPDEACDDGNTRSGDGCSATCTIEPGYACTAQIAPQPDYLDLPIVLRDFKYYDAADLESHPDFERYGCGVASVGLTQPNLGVAPAARVPLWAKSAGAATCSTANQLTSATDFTDWYADVMVNGKTRGKRFDDTMMRLVKQGDGSYLFDSDKDEPYKTAGGFYPLDGKPGSWGNQGASHNYSFTTELRYWFTYDALKKPELTFSGDDDLWVFVNGKIALDIGGLHPRIDDSFVLDAGKAAALGLVDGQMYEVAVFNAERHTDASNFKLTLRDFLKKRSVCTETCGDGIKTSSEQCDKGVANTNSGAYGSCRLDCTLGPYCGDKVTTNPPETCDDGVNLTPWTLSSSSLACGPSCKKPSFCGDAVVQGTFGERCDNGTANNTGGYGQCAANCQPGPRCGDGAVQAGNGEVCDNGFNLTSYIKHPAVTDCAPGCKKPSSCGDGAVNFPFEQCDTGVNNANAGTYGACTLECVLGPRCGDGVVNGPEECDDGNRINGDGCSAACLREGVAPR